MAGIEAMHRRFGRLPMRRLFAPAIWYADHGVPVTGLLAAYFQMGTAQMLKTAEGRRFALPDGANLPKLGARYRQPELAALYRAVAANGAREMYRGAWARHYVDVVRRAGGAATMADLRAYAPRWGEPLRLAYDGATVAGPDANNISSCAALEALNLIDMSVEKATSTPSAAPRWHFVWQCSAIGAPQLPRSKKRRTSAAIAWRALAMPMAPPHRQDRGDAQRQCRTGAGRASQRVGGGSGPLGQCRSASPFEQHTDLGRFWDGGGWRAGPGSSRHLSPLARQPGTRRPRPQRPGRRQAGVRDRYDRIVGGTRDRSPDSRVARFGQPHHYRGRAAAAAQFEDQTLPILAREEYVPAGRYPPALLDGVRASGLRIREIDAQRTLTLRGTASVVVIGRDRRSAEAPGVLAFAAAE